MGVRVFVAGAGGVVGRRLIPVLVRKGHRVVGMVRTEEGAARVRAAGGTPVVVDALDADAVARAVVKAKPETIVNQLTSIPLHLDLRRYAELFAPTDQLRREGTRNLIEAGREAGVKRIITQSVAFGYAHGGDDRLRRESDPLDPSPPPQTRASLAAIADLESQVLTSHDLKGVVLRYGFFYGPGTVIAPEGDIVERLRHRGLPIVGSGRGVWSFVHVADVATVTAQVVETPAAEGIYNVVDDDPAPVTEWLPALAAAVHAPRPMHVPGLIAKLTIGEHLVVQMTQSRGASNARAKKELGWKPLYPSWREGFRTGLN